MTGKNAWYIIDGYRPPENAGDVAYEGHEAIMILNCNDEDAHCQLDIYFTDSEPILGIPYTAPARRISAFRTDDPEIFGQLKLKVNQQYSLCVRSDIGIIVQYGRCDISQPNLAYMAVMGYTE